MRSSNSAGVMPSRRSRSFFCVGVALKFCAVRVHRAGGHAGGEDQPVAVDDAAAARRHVVGVDEAAFALCEVEVRGHDLHVHRTTEQQQEAQRHHHHQHAAAPRRRLGGQQRAAGVGQAAGADRRRLLRRFRPIIWPRLRRPRCRPRSASPPGSRCASRASRAPPSRRADAWPAPGARPPGACTRPAGAPPRRARGWSR